MSPLFEDVQVGDEIPAAEYGPLTILDTVRWAGVQENPQRLHWDAEYARTHSGMRTFIASGAHRQALLARTITDWIGPDGALRRLSLRHVAPTYAGDLMIFGGTVVEKSPEAADPWVACEVTGRNQDDERIVAGRCTVVLPVRRTRAP